jgi:flagellar basal-body rod modification protein FlgD
MAGNPGLDKFMQITSTSPVTTQDTTVKTERVPVQTLGQDDFLKLLIAQLTSQDPLNPQKDTEFIAQMAQFSSLEQSKEMQKDIATLRSQQQILQAQELLGKTVDLQAGEDTTARGVVSAVQIEAGTPKLMVNGQKYDLSDVLTINPTLPEQS